MHLSKPIKYAGKLVYINRMLKSVIDQRFSHILIVGDFNMKRLTGPCVKVQRTKNTDHLYFLKESKIVSEYDQEIPQSQTADNPMAPRGRATQPSRNTRKTN